MNCDELKSAIYAYVEHELSDGERASFDLHMRGCESCSALVTDVQKLSCRDFVQFLNDYFEDELPEQQRSVFDRHMELCPPCGDYLRSYERTIELGRVACAEQDQELPGGIPDNLVRAILRARREQA